MDDTNHCRSEAGIGRWRVQKSLAKNLQVLFLAHSRSVFGYRTNVHGFVANTFPGSDVLAAALYPVTPFYARVWTDKT
jgi:hypothetical protein